MRQSRPFNEFGHKLENIQIANTNKYGNEGLKGDDDRPKFGPLDSLKGAKNVGEQQTAISTVHSSTRYSRCPQTRVSHARPHNLLNTPVPAISLPEIGSGNLLPSDLVWGESGMKSATSPVSNTSSIAQWPIMWGPLVSRKTRKPPKPKKTTKTNGGFEQFQNMWQSSLNHPTKSTWDEFPSGSARMPLTNPLSRSRRCESTSCWWEAWVSNRGPPRNRVFCKGQKQPPPTKLPRLKIGDVGMGHPEH